MAVEFNRKKTDTMVIGFPKMQGAIIPLLKGLQSKQTRQKRRAAGRNQDLEVKWLAGEHRAGQSWKGDNVLFSRLAGFPEAMAKMTSLLLGLSESPFSFTFFHPPVFFQFSTVDILQDVKGHSPGLQVR